jgi:putative spermidine/putrescine transport system permease protein
MTTDTRTLGQQIAGIAQAGIAYAVLVFLVAPIAVIVPLSFSSGSFFHYPLPGFSLRWYEDFFTSPFWLFALKNSLFLGSVSASLATVLGTLAAIGLWRANFALRGVILAVLISPMVVPVVIVAVGAYFAFAPLHLTDGFTGLIMVHTALGAPFVVITVLATLSGFDRNLLRAASVCGADPIIAFFRVMLPAILPGIASGAVFAFATSFDEVVVVLLMGGPEQRTLPRQMFAGINDNISLTITAAATLLIAVSTLLMATVGALKRRAAAPRAAAQGAAATRAAPADRPAQTPVAPLPALPGSGESVPT